MKTNNNNVDKPLASAPKVEEAIKQIKIPLMKAEKDPMTHIELELMNRIDEAFKQAQEDGFKGSFTDWLDTQSADDLKSIATFSSGGSVDFTGLTPGQMKAIFVSENGYMPGSPRELVRGVKMYLKGMDLKGLPIGAFGK